MCIRDRRYASLETDAQAAIKAAVVDVGRPVTITSALLAAGFLVLTLGSFEPSRQIGQVVAIVIVVAVLADLLLLPALLSLFTGPRPDGDKNHG